MEKTNVHSVIDNFLILIVIGLSIAFVYFIIAFSHHWKFYSFNFRFKQIAQGLYFFVSLLILIALIIFVSIYIFDYGI